jgi:hypothetical protein
MGVAAAKTKALINPIARTANLIVRAGIDRLPPTNTLGDVQPTNANDANRPRTTMLSGKSGMGKSALQLPPLRLFAIRA